MKIQIPYRPRAIWRDTLHPAFDKCRFGVLVAHRRLGKTVGSVNAMLKKAVLDEKRSPQYAYIAPYRNQAKMIAWNYLKYYASNIPNLRINESELYIEIPTRHKGAVGARIYIVGADKPDALRGTYWDGVILDEYAQIKPELWGEIIRPALADRKGFAWFIGTPKGQNQFYDKYKESLSKDDWFSFIFRATETGIIDDEELEDMKRNMTDIEYRQEMLCDFTVSAFNILITIDMVETAVARHYTEAQIKGMPCILGVDVARFGDDRSVIACRQGEVLYEPQVYKGIDNMELVARIIEAIRKYDPVAVFIDAGGGSGVIDRLRQLGYTNIIEVAFGSSAENKDKYINLRTEMWHKMADWIRSTGSLPDMPELKAELTVVEYGFDNADRRKLKKKEDIKKDFGMSPDIADAVALTFAHSVNIAKPDMYNRSVRYCNTSYDPFA